MTLSILGSFGILPQDKGSVCICIEGTTPSAFMIVHICDSQHLYYYASKAVKIACGPLTSSNF